MAFFEDKRKEWEAKRHERAEQRRVHDLLSKDEFTLM